MDRQVVVLAYDKATKNKYVYKVDNPGEAPVIQSLYIEKYVMEGEPPPRIRVTVEVT